MRCDVVLLTWDSRLAGIFRVSVRGIVNSSPIFLTDIVRSGETGNDALPTIAEERGHSWFDIVSANRDDASICGGLGHQSAQFCRFPKIHVKFSPTPDAITLVSAVRAIHLIAATV